MTSEVKHLTGRVLRRQIEALERISAEEKVDRSAALRKVLDIGLQEYMKRKAVEDYRRGRVSIGKAAEDAGISMAEFYKVLADEGVPIKVDVEAIKDALRKDFGDRAG
jgi:DNA-binding phage protein